MTLPKGLSYIPNAINAGLIKRILTFLESDEFQKELFSVSSSQNGRKVMHYGYTYNYNRNGKNEPTTPIPPLIRELLDQPNLVERIDVDKFNQCIINRYLPGQGINKHIDSLQYGNTIVCFTVGSGATMTFTRDEDVYDIYTEPNSVYVMQDDARYKWKHEMKNRKNDVIDGKKIARGIRWSITFREV